MRIWDEHALQHGADRARPVSRLDGALLGAVANVLGASAAFAGRISMCPTGPHDQRRMYHRARRRLYTIAERIERRHERRGDRDV